MLLDLVLDLEIARLHLKEDTILPEPVRDEVHYHVAKAIQLLRTSPFVEAVIVGMCEECGHMPHEEMKSLSGKTVMVAHHAPNCKYG